MGRVEGLGSRKNAADPESLYTTIADEEGSSAQDGPTLEHMPPADPTSPSSLPEAEDSSTPSFEPLAVAPAMPPPLPPVVEAAADAEGTQTFEELPPPKPYPGFWQAFGLFVIWMVVSVVVVIPAAVADSIQKNQHQEITTHPAVLGLATIASSVTVLLVAKGNTGRGIRQLFAWVPVSPVVFLAAAGMVVSIVTLGILSFIWIERFFPGSVPKLDYGFSKSRWIALFVIVIAAPFCEEVLFRGIFLRGFSKRYGMVRGIALSSLFFAIAHGSLARLPHTFALGAALGWLYMRSRSLWVSVSAHLFNNLIAGAFLVFARPAGEKSATTTPAFPIPPFHWSELVLTALAGLILLVSIQAVRSQRAENGNQAEF